LISEELKTWLQLTARLRKGSLARPAEEQRERRLLGLGLELGDREAEEELVVGRRVPVEPEVSPWWGADGALSESAT